MNQDLFYIYDKLTKIRSVLGEIQSDFNMSLVIDGTKDSMKVIVWSFSGVEIEPNTICQHEATNTWWIVKRDRVERHLSDNNKFVYIHNLQLNGAVELFNARDLTDCGFYQNTYTIRQFINRLISLSSLEYSVSLSAPTNFLNKKVDYVKTFENYTLLSALRELLDGYNMCAKATFSTNTAGTNVLLSSITLNILPKTGDTTLTTHLMTEFNDVRETKTMDSNSFGTTVISNAENVIASKPKQFPSLGAVRVSADSFRTLAQNGVIRLPSNVYKGNWIKMISKNAPVEFDIHLTGATIYPHFYKINPVDKVALKSALDELGTHIPNNYSALVSAFGEAKSSMFKAIYDFVFKSGSITLYNGNEINAFDGTIVKGENVPYLALVWFTAKIDPPSSKYIFCSEEDKKNLVNTYQGISWKRGSNEIKGFDAFVPDTGKQGEISWIPSNGDLQGTTYLEICNDGQGNYIRVQLIDGTPCGGHFEEITWIVSYYPMNDLKVKVDNQRTKKDTQLYNQNGRLTDSVAFSKLINSYSKEISSDNVTKYKAYRNFNNVPKIGSIVNDNGTLYVVNNISMDFSQNEKDNTHFGYYIECEITMSKAIAVKSMMVNPNTNIRDYGIPQSFNVKRKQVYRDYYELDYVAYDDREWDYYLSPLKSIRFSHESADDDLTALIKVTYDNPVNGNSSYYYQLPIINYYMCKMAYFVLDFNDNNIIGYGSQNVYSGFDITRIFRRQTDLVNTPISYVDSNGKLKGIEIYGVGDTNLEQLYTLYESSQETNQYYASWKDDYGTLYTFFNFIPEEIYNLAAYLYSSLEDNLLRITETNYNKDAIEVPVFEYACQIEDTDRILIGDNILTQREDCIYLYSYETGDNLTVETANTDNAVTIVNGRANVDDAVELTIRHNQALIDGVYYRTSCVDITMFENQAYNLSTKQVSNTSQINIPLGHDIAIFRHAYNTITGEVTTDLMFICKSVTPYQLFNSTTIRLQLNHYKLD